MKCLWSDHLSARIEYGGVIGLVKVFSSLNKKKEKVWKNDVGKRIYDVEWIKINTEQVTLA